MLILGVYSSGTAYFTLNGCFLWFFRICYTLQVLWIDKGSPTPGALGFSSDSFKCFYF